MKILNRVEEKKPEPTKKHWYRVAILRNGSGAFYTCVIDKPHHQTEIESRATFVRWEPVVEVEV